jgi:hypothetical protein
LYRAAALILAFVVVLFAVRLAVEPVRALHKPDVRPVPDAFETVGTLRAEGRDAAGSASDKGEPKIGNFEAPKYVPDYKILEKNLDSRDSAHAVRLLIDARSRAGEFRPYRPRPEVTLLRLRRGLGRVHRYRRLAFLQGRFGYQGPARLLRWRAHLQHLRRRTLLGIHLRTTQHGRLLRKFC